MQKRARVPCGRALSRARLARMSTVSHAMRPLTSHGGDFVRHAFTSLADEFACHAFFSIARRRFRVLRVCFLHRTVVISHTAHAFATSPMISHAMRSYIARRRFRTPCVLYIARRRIRVLRVCFLHRTAVISHTAHAFISPADDFARRACFYTKGREKYDFKGSDF